VIHSGPYHRHRRRSLAVVATPDIIQMPAHLLAVAPPLGPHRPLVIGFVGR